MEFATLPETEASMWESTGVLRLIVPTSTTTESAKLQVMWVERFSGKRQWRSVPTVVVSDSEFSEA